MWDAQRRYYQRAGIEAWRSATVPHHVTNSVALASAYARVVRGFLADTQTREPLTIVELGAGAGRFAFLFLRALQALDPRAALRVRYVMTDVADRTIAFWRRHPALAPFVRAGRLDFARLDADRDRTLRLVHARRTITANAPASALVVIASYVFSGLRHDAFVTGPRGLRDYLVATGRAARPEDMTLAWRVGGRVATPYAEPHLSAIVSASARGAQPRRLAFPVGPLRCLDRLSALTRDAVLLLVADRAMLKRGPLAGGAELGLGRHGAVSFPFSFPALRAWGIRHGGTSLRPSRHARHVHVEGLVVRKDGAAPRTRAAWSRAMAGGGPDGIYAERRRLSMRVSAWSPRRLIGLMRRAGSDAGGDPRVIAECVRPLWTHLADAPPSLRRELRDAVLAAWPNYYHFSEAQDLAFDLGLLLYEVRAYANARTLFEQSLRLYGDDAATRWNLGLCHVAVGHARAAHAAFARARRLAPMLLAAGPVTVKGARYRDLPHHECRSAR